MCMFMSIYTHGSTRDLCHTCNINVVCDVYVYDGQQRVDFQPTTPTEYQLMNVEHYTYGY